MRHPREQATRLPLLVLLCVRLPMAGALAVTAAGLLLLTGVDAQGSYLADVLPGMLITGAGLGVAVVCVAVSVLSGAADKESGMLSGLNTTGHEIGGSLGVAVLVTVASATGGAQVSSAGLADAYLVAGIIAGAASLLALVILPSARSFLPRLRLAPSLPIH
jgi:sugar phosphate permease